MTTPENTLDSSDIYGSLNQFANQFQDGFTWSDHITTLNTPRKVVVAGMGGSANFVDLINSLFVEQLPDPIRISRNYAIPNSWIGPDTLVIVCSFSGNTEETISAYHQAIAAHAQVIVISSGGKLIELAQTNTHPYVQIIKPSPGFQPRIGLGYFFASIIHILTVAKWLPATSRNDLLAAVQAQDSEAVRMAGEEVAKALANTIPVFYAPDHLWPIARIAKININENSKVPAFWNFLPEANHNEMMGFLDTEHPYCIVMILDPTDHPQNIKRFYATTVIYNDLGLKTYLTELRGNTVLEKGIYGILLTMWAAYFVAIHKGIDPAPVPLVERLKSELV